MIARPENRNTTAAPISRPTRLFGFATLSSDSRFSIEPALTIDGSDGVGVGTEQRRRGQNRGGDGDALGDGLRGVADRVQVGEDPSAVLVDVTGHLGDALGVVRDRAERVHRDDDADGGQQAGAGERDGEQRQDDRATAQQEGAVHTGADDQGRVDRGLEADRDTREDDGGRAGQRRLADVLDRTAAGLGEVAGERLEADEPNR